MLKKNISIRSSPKILINKTIQGFTFNLQTSRLPKEKKNKKKSLYSRKKKLSLQLIIYSL